MVRPMRHAGPQVGPERTAPGHDTVCTGGGEKEITARGGGTREGLERDFEAYGKPINNISAFRYLGRVLTAGDDD